ncbi:hypothetical protein C922_01551 [Plasmodium inui San Antonio 1]|uniref:NAA35-like N-terminal domain-containing protein n=1 Tax=Plasmodium inui San Antonio 1 TaxID=1237626 RepID=W7AFX4_9APIC|nr:hypothetical protein C922_01551 [Plasmodium inui San Antonio 1]EUD67939.1 hypothetical protein C922_01551 [Plasmodium inui San Antonio 1]
MEAEKEYLDISDLLRRNVEDLNDEDEIRVSDFSYGKYVCSLEMGDNKLDVGIKPEKRITIKECEDKGYLSEGISLEDMVLIMDNLLLQQVKVLLGNHPFLTVLSCYFVHHSSVINCNGDSFFFEKIFYKCIKSLSADSIYMNIFQNDNREFLQLMQRGVGEQVVAQGKSASGAKDEHPPTEGYSKEMGPTQKDNPPNKSDAHRSMCEEGYLRYNPFTFFQLFLILYASTAEIIDHVVTKNSWLHRDDYKGGLLKITDSLIYHCRRRRRYVMKNLFLVKRCFPKFLAQYESARRKRGTKGSAHKGGVKEGGKNEGKNEGKNGDKDGRKDVGQSGCHERDKGESHLADPPPGHVLPLLRRIQFCIHLNTMLNQVIFESREMNTDSIKENCKELLKCIRTINEEVGSKCQQQDKQIRKKYFNKYFLMYKLNSVSKHVTKMSVHEGYSFFEKVTLDIDYIVEYFQRINAKSSFFDVKNLVHYVKFYSASGNVLVKCISRGYIQQVLNNARGDFLPFERDLLLKEEIKAKRFFHSLEGAPPDGKVERPEKEATRQQLQEVEKMQQIPKEDPLEKREDDQAESITLDPAPPGALIAEQNHQWDDYDENRDVGHYYSLFLNTYRKEETDDVPSTRRLNEKFSQNVKQNIFVSFFLHLFFNESYVILEEVSKEDPNFFVKSVIFNDLCYFGFSPPLLVLLSYFFYSPDTFFFAMEHVYQVDKGLTYTNEEEYKTFCGMFFPPCAVKKLERDLRLHFPYLINYMQKESSLLELFTELEEFIDECAGVGSAPWGVDQCKSEEERGSNCVSECGGAYQGSSTVGENQPKGECAEQDKRAKRGNGTRTDGRIHERTTSPAIITSKRFKLTVLCKIFHLFMQYLEIVLKKVLNFSFLLAPREHSKLTGFHTDMCVLYTLMKILAYYFKLYNMNSEMDSVENYLHCIFHTVLIDYSCLSLYINIPSDQEYAFTYYVMSLSYKELAGTVQKGFKLNCAENRSKLIYSLIYYILYLYSDFLMIYFVYFSYTNVDSEPVEEDSYNMKYKAWNFCYPDISKINFYNFQKNKAALINAVLTKNLKITLLQNDEINIGVKKKIKNLAQVKESYRNSKKRIDQYSSLLDIKNYFSHNFRFFEKTSSDVDICSYFKGCVSEIQKLIKDASSCKYDNIGFVRIFLNSYEQNLIKSYKKFPPFCVENSSIFLNPYCEVVNGHSYFLSVQERKKKKT